MKTGIILFQDFSAPEHSAGPLDFYSSMKIKYMFQFYSF